MSSTEMQGADPQAIRANKLALVERLADDLAHEIKNPLHSMVINLEVLRRRISRLQDGEQGDLMRYAGVLGSELDRVTRRIDLLLRLVRPERTGDLTTLAETMGEMLDLLELERERHGVTVEFAAGEEPLRGHIPREVARQLALNVLLEALDTLPAGSTLAIRTEATDGRALLRLEAILPDGGPTSAPDSSRLSVARALTQSLQGELQVEGADGADPEGEPRLGITVSIPLTHG